MVVGSSPTVGGSVCVVIVFDLAVQSVAGVPLKHLKTVGFGVDGGRPSLVGAFGIGRLPNGGC